MDSARDFFAITKLTAKDFVEDDCPRSAAALSYYTIFALPPLLVLILTIVGAVVDPQTVREELTTQVGRVLGAEGAEQIKTMIQSAQGSDRGWLAGIIGTLALLVGATAVVVQLQDSLNRVWEVKPDPKKGGVKVFIRKRIVSLGMILGVAFLLLVSLVVTTVITAMSEQISGNLGGAAAPLIEIANFVAAFAIITVLFALMFKYLPDVRVEWREVWIGSVITSLLFVAGKFALGFYLGSRDLGSSYGAAASLALILLWVYYSGLIFFFGAEFTQAWAKWHGHPLVPETGAVRVVQIEQIEPAPEPARKRDRN